MLSIISKIKFHLFHVRIGPDMFLTHWMLHFKFLMRWLAKKRLGSFGDNSEIRPGSYLNETNNIYLGKGVVIRPGSMIFAVGTEASVATITIGDNVMLGSGVHIYAGNHLFDDLNKDIIDQGHLTENVTIANNVWVGSNAIILKGVNIGTHTVVAAGSVVDSNLDSYSVYGGNPARKIRSLK